MDVRMGSDFRPAGGSVISLGMDEVIAVDIFI